MSNNPIPEHLRSNYLFLLVGTNPLPNWVAAKLLWKNQGEGKVFLIYTPGTKKPAERLGKILADRDKIPSEGVPTVEASAEEIYKTITSTINRLYQSKLISTVGLNYTGGTKMMSVHAHQAMIDSKLAIRPVLSYLDARTLCMKFDGGDPNGYQIGLSTNVQIGLRKLLDLHEDYVKEEDVKYETESKWELAAAALAQIHTIWDGQEAWRNWCYNHLKLNTYDSYKMKNDNKYYENNIREIDSIILPTKHSFQMDIAGLAPYDFEPLLNGYEAFLKALGVVGNCSLKDIASQNKFKNSYELARWLDGQWLEHYALAEIKKCATSANINDEDGFGINIEAKNKEGRLFEADVIALRGYQLFYFSCYSGSKHKDAKMKLFEAMIRASQLGGDEAMVALVSCVDNAKKIEREAEADWQKVEKVKVFGRDDLETLSTHLTKWFNRK